MGSKRDEKASEVGSREDFAIIRLASRGQEIALLDPESKTSRPLGSATRHDPEQEWSKKNPSHVSWGFPWAVSRAAGKREPMEETEGVSFWVHGAGQRRMEREWGHGGDGETKREDSTAQTRFRDYCNGLGKRH